MGLRKVPDRRRRAARGCATNGLVCRRRTPPPRGRASWDAILDRPIQTKPPRASRIKILKDVSGTLQDIQAPRRSARVPGSLWNKFHMILPCRVIWNDKIQSAGLTKRPRRLKYHEGAGHPDSPQSPVNLPREDPRALRYHKFVALITPAEEQKASLNTRDFAVFRSNCCTRFFAVVEIGARPLPPAGSSPIGLHPDASLACSSAGGLFRHDSTAPSGLWILQFNEPTAIVTRKSQARTNRAPLSVVAACRPCHRVRW